MSDKRSFTVVSVTLKGKSKGSSHLGGRFLSSSASGAARKAATQVCRNSRVKGQCEVKVTLKETTRGSSGKEYKYSVKRVKLRTPQVVVRDDVEVVYKYTTRVKALK